MPSPIVQTLNRYFSSKKGNVTLILALSAAPLIGIAGVAIDTLRIINARSDAQVVADSAALAAAASKGTVSQKKQIALQFANANLRKLYGVTSVATADAVGKTVTVAVDSTVQGTFLVALFPASTSSSSQSGTRLPTVNFKVQSKVLAEPSKSYYSCMIALNGSMAKAVYIRGTGDFLADKCVVQSNSTSATGMTFQGNANATAEAFMSSGNYQKIGNSGNLSPTPQVLQKAIPDPINLGVTDPGGVASAITVKKQNGNVSLSAAKYSDITIQTQGQATFTPGTHYITGTLSLGSQAVLNGSGVTIVLLGPNAKIDMNSGGTLMLQAPTSGTYKGYAVIGDKSNSTVLTNTIQGGASGYVRGIWYTPKHKFYVTGNGDFNSTSNYFPVIADNIEIGGNGYFHTGADWASYGFPEPAAIKVTAATKVQITN